MQQSLTPVEFEGPARRVSEEPRRRPRGAEIAAADATCSCRVVQPFAKYLASKGHDAEAWLKKHDLTLATLKDRDRRIPHALAVVLLREAVEICGDPSIGVRAARFEEAGDFDVLEYAAANCATIGDAMRLAVRFMALMHDGISMELEVAPPHAALRVRVMPGLGYIPAGIEFLFASLLSYGSRFVGHPTRPLRVDLAHPGPPDRSAHEECFREVRFNAEEHVMWIFSAALDLPHRAADGSLLEILTSHADGLLRQLSPHPLAQSFVDRARAAITEELSTGNPGAEQVAKRLAISLRTLHRRLAEHGTSHRELVDDVRQTQAMMHLGGMRFSIGEISFLLGFAHPNAFHKAFKRWTRMTPAQYRDDAYARASAKR